MKPAGCNPPAIRDQEVKYYAKCGREHGRLHDRGNAERQKTVPGEALNLTKNAV